MIVEQFYRTDKAIVNGDFTASIATGCPNCNKYRVRLYIGDALMPAEYFTSSWDNAVQHAEELVNIKPKPTRKVKTLEVA